MSMSSSRGNNCRKRPQKHQNKTAFKNDLHDTSRKTKFLNSLEVSGVCKRCKDIIDWKIKYKKYKPLTAPAKCVGCSEKAIKYAYHVLCGKCATEKKVCAKCCKQPDMEEIPSEDNSGLKEDIDLQTALKGLPERKRRTVLRFLSKHGDAENKVTPEVKSLIDDVMARVNKFDFDDDDFESSVDDDEDKSVCK